ncbi:GntR family transcriptional regulator [Neobacillus niacini]|uniref:GntR family transcriptional regulator n=1 Tax=Neobacillus niacini TaxID=86668 RepID=UPI0030027163
MIKKDNAGSKTLRTYEYIKEGLQSGRWTFGDVISVVEIANELDVSRRPVIDALKRLETEYFVEIVPQTGCRVKNYSKDEMFDHFLTVMVLEGMSAYLAAQRRNESEIEVLYQINQELNRVVEKQPFSSENYFAVNRRLHGQILQMARSEKLQEITSSQWDLNDFFLANIPLIHEKLSQTISEHELIFEKIFKKDFNGARSMMENHMYNFALLVKRTET